MMLPPVGSPEWEVIKRNILTESVAADKAMVTRTPEPCPLKVGDRFVVSVESREWGRVAIVTEVDVPYYNETVSRMTPWIVKGYLDGDQPDKWRYWNANDVERVLEPGEVVDDVDGGPASNPAPTDTAMLGSRLIADQIDDDMIRRLVHAIEELADGYQSSFPTTAEVVESVIDGDLFLAYREVRSMMAESYPDTYGSEVTERGVADLIASSTKIEPAE